MWYTWTPSRCTWTLARYVRKGGRIAQLVRARNFAQHIYFSLPSLHVPAASRASFTVLCCILTHLSGPKGVSGAS